MSIREQALVALSALFGATFAADAEVLVGRNDGFTERLDEVGKGWINLFDGAADAPPQGLIGAPVDAAWEHTHLARAVVIARDDAAFDAIVTAMAAAVGPTETLGGLVDLAEVRAAEDLDPETAALCVGFKVGVVPILLLYTAGAAG